jgi:hypothetical protein
VAARRKEAVSLRRRARDRKVPKRSVSCESSLNPPRGDTFLCRGHKGGLTPGPKATHI